MCECDGDEGCVGERACVSEFEERAKGTVGVTVNFMFWLFWRGYGRQ